MLTELWIKVYERVEATFSNCPILITQVGSEANLKKGRVLNDPRI